MSGELSARLEAVVRATPSLMHVLTTVRGLALPDWLGVYLLIVNVAAFATYGADKRRAKQGRWRVPEKTLFLLAIVGGSVGALLGMWCFHHKTRHWYFRYGIPAILVVQLALAGWLWLR